MTFFRLHSYIFVTSLPINLVREIENKRETGKFPPIVLKFLKLNNISVTLNYRMEGCYLSDGPFTIIEDPQYCIFQGAVG